MNINKIFSIFDTNKEPFIESFKNEEFILDENVLAEYWVRMYKKLILNFITLGKEFLKKINNDLNLDLQDVEKAGEFIMYNTAWAYISNIDTNNNIHLKVLKNHKDKHLIKYLNLGIKHFEFIEDYKKCAFLKNIVDKIK